MQRSRQVYAKKSSDRCKEVGRSMQGSRQIDARKSAGRCGEVGRSMQESLKKILVSECLYGERTVRYDGKNKEESHPCFLKWKEEGRLVPVCPEVFGGLTVPRIDAQRQGDRIVNRKGEDVTAEYMAGAEEALRLAKEHDVFFCIMKQSSPSCGSREIYDGSFTGRKIPGEGLTVELLRKEGFVVFGEDEIDRAADYMAKLGE